MTTSNIVDLRSDTFTLPTPEMRQAMASAEVGDDVFGEDPTINRLEAQVAELFGKEAALFVPSGTMANQVSINTHTQPGDEIICHRLSHIYQYEGGAPAVLSGCTFAFVEGARGMFTADDVRANVRADNEHFPRTSLIVIENTQNRGGGAVWPLAQITAIRDVATELRLKIHLDGARIMNACVATGTSPRDFAKHTDSVSICFSKGLGAPVGSAIAGSKTFIAQARRARKRFGGGMRQAGILAAAALYALEHHVERLADDHTNAQRLADGIAELPGISVETPETNIVYFNVDESLGTAAGFVSKLNAEHVRMFDVAPQRIRAVTHLHITADMIDRAIAVITRVAKSSG